MKLYENSFSTLGMVQELELVFHLPDFLVSSMFLPNKF